VLVPSVSESCGAVDDANCSRKRGVVVPKPVKLFVKMLLDIDDVDSNDPTVSCDPVAVIAPVEFEVRIELAANVVAPAICVARVEVEIVDCIPFVPVKVKPCDRDER
jgi:hypothetical protein